MTSREQRAPWRLEIATDLGAAAEAVWAHATSVADIQRALFRTRHRNLLRQFGASTALA